MKKKSERLDVLLVEKGFFTSREKAKGAIMAGRVLVDNQKIDKVGKNVPLDSDIRIIGEGIPYVSRGGLKLEKALNSFHIDIKGKVLLDVGASTGGFTDCALQNGARMVYSVDVGYGQLAWKLRQDKRVVCMERTNIRNLMKDDLPLVPQFATIDVSFISLTIVLPVVKQLLSEDGEIVALIKPQFEAGREKVGKKGVVKDPAIHEEVIEKTFALAKKLNLLVKNLTFSPVKGPEGNIEYLIYLSKVFCGFSFNPLDIPSLVAQAHQELSK